MDSGRVVITQTQNDKEQKYPGRFVHLWLRRKSSISVDISCDRSLNRLPQLGTHPPCAALTHLRNDIELRS